MAGNERINEAARRSFSLNKIASVVAGYRAPATGSTSSAEYVHSYAHCTIVDGHFGEEGELAIRRTAGDGGSVILDVDHSRRGTSGFFHFTQAHAVCKNDVLTTPVSWTVSTKLAQSADAPAHLFSGMTKTGRFDGGALHVAIGDKETSIPIDGALTSDWSLLHTVTCIPPDTPPPEFLLLDKLDTALPGHRLKPGDTVDVALGNSTHVLRSFVRLGPGTLPVVYWVDLSGRPLFVVSGEEVFLLKKSGDVAAEYSLGRLEMKPALKDRTIP